MQYMTRRGAIEIISSLLASLFVYAAISKLLDYRTFRVQLSQSPFITHYAGFISWLLPAAELFTAIFLAFATLRLIALYASLFLLTLFTSYLIAMLNFSYYVPCSCGGILSSLSWKQHIILNLFFLVLSLAGIVLCIKEKQEQPLITSR